MDAAAQVDVESKKLKQDLVRQKDEVQLKLGELQKLEKYNEDVKGQEYDDTIEDLTHQIFVLDKKRTQWQTKL